MSKVKTILGIDISKDTFDVYDPERGHRRYQNDLKGFRSFIKTLSKDSWAVMEATGSYHHRLALFLYEKEIFVSVVNPLVVKRFIQMKLNRVKTDKSNATMIYRYGKEQTLSPWRPDPVYVNQCKELHSVVQLYFKQHTALSNKLHSLVSKGLTKGKAITSLKRQVRTLEKEIALLEKEMLTLIQENEADLYTRVKSIPGLGKKTALLLIISTNGFKDFESSKQISSYFGLAPHERSSGSSVRGKTRIGKNGHPCVRNHLFLCSFTACVHNPQCRALYERLVEKGKSKKLALIAISNKLIKQAYGIAKSGTYYDENYSSKLV